MASRVYWLAATVCPKSEAFAGLWAYLGAAARREDRLNLVMGVRGVEAFQLTIPLRAELTQRRLVALLGALLGHRLAVNVRWILVSHGVSVGCRQYVIMQADQLSVFARWGAQNDSVRIGSPKGGFPLRNT